MTLLLAVVIVALAVYFAARAIQSLHRPKTEIKALTLPDGDTSISICGQHGEIIYSILPSIEAYEKGGKTTFDRQADIDIAIEDAQMWARKTNL